MCVWSCSVSQPLRSLRKLLHLTTSSSSSSNQTSADLHYPLPPQSSSKGGSFVEPRGLSSMQSKSRQAAYAAPGPLESGWHSTALGRPEGNPYPEQLTSKPGFARHFRSRLPNLNDLKETAL